MVIILPVVFPVRYVEGLEVTHSFYHYVMECPTLAHFRPEAHSDLPSLVTWFINNNVVPDIIKEYPKFAPRF